MSTIHRFFLKPWLYFAIVIIGTALKFHHLNYKLFWEDEVSTVLYTTGLKGGIMKQKILVNQIKSISYYDSLIHPSSHPYTLKSQIAGIFSDTHLTPAHYAFLTVWYRLVGDEELDYRLFSVFCFILSLPFLFLLARNLFNSNLAAWIAVSLFSVSPFINFESQEARYYMLWVFFFILSNYLLLQMINQKKVFWWVAYVISVILALYTSALSGILLFGHLVYISILNRELLSKFALSIILIVLAYLPWMYFLYNVRGTIESGLAWHKFSHSTFFTLDLLFFQLLGLVKTFSYFFDSDIYFLLTLGTVTPSTYLALFTDLIVLLPIIGSIFYLSLKAPKQIKWFITLGIFPLFFLFYITDTFRQSFTSALWRYQIVNMVWITLVVTNLLKDKIEKGYLIYIGVFVGFILLGITSILKIENARCWNTRPDCESNINEAGLIASARRPLLITDFSGWGFANFLAVINESSASDAEIMYSKGENLTKMVEINSKAYSHIYVVQASDSLVKKLQLQFGNDMLPLKKEANPMSPQIWQIQLRE